MTLRGSIFIFCILSAFPLIAFVPQAEDFNPFYEQAETEEGSFFAVRPFYSHTVRAEGEITDVFWPLYSRKSFKDEKTSRTLFFWFTHNFNASDSEPRQRRWLFPILFQGKDAAGESYFTLFPLGGTVHEIFGRDEVACALWPLWGESRINDVQTTTWFWPVLSWTHGEGVERFRIFPLYGISHRDGRYDKTFLLWPFWSHARYHDPAHAGTAWILFPLCGRIRLENETTHWLFPPFFRFTEGSKENRLYCPWPFIQRVEGERFDKTYIWPLWGRKRLKNGLHDRTFLLWPFFWSEKSGGFHGIKTRRMALPFFYYEKESRREESRPEEEWPVVFRYWKVWPLASWQREGECARFRLLELWPLRHTAPIERNWTPLWTFYRRTCDTEGMVQHDALWFIWRYRNHVDAGCREWSLLRGLAGYKKNGDQRSFRLLYHTFGE